MGEHLRYKNPDGTSKDWIIEELPNGDVRTSWGKTGKRMQSTVIPLDRCEGGTQAEYHRRLAEKLNKGYVPVQVTPQTKAAVKAAEAEQGKKALESVQVKPMEGFVLF